MERTQRTLRAGTEYGGKEAGGIVHPIRRDRLTGMQYTQIAEKYRIDPRTAKRYAENNLPLDDLEHRPFPSVLDPYKPTIHRWLADEPIPARAVWNKLRAMGCLCGYTIVNDYVKKARQALTDSVIPDAVPLMGK